MKRIFTILLCSVLASFNTFGQTTIFSENIGTPSGTTAISANTFQNSGTLTYSNGGAANSADCRITSASTGYTGASGGANVFFTSTNASYGFAIEGINAANYTSLTVQFGYRKESASALPTLALEYWNGSAYVAVSYSFSQATNASIAWYLSPTISLPAAAQINGLKLRWVKSGTTSVRIDDIILKGTVSSTPTLSVSTSSLSAFSSTVAGQNSTSQTFNLSGSNFTNASGNITVTAPNTDFQVSSDNISFGATATIPYTANALATTAVYARFTPQSEGAKSGNITFSDPGGVTTLPTVALSGTGVAPCTTPSVVTSFSGTNGNTQSVLTWTNGLCFDEILVIARASSAVAATPSGDGSAYTANAAFGSGTDVGSSQFVVYKGTGTTQTVTSLTNGTTYHFAVYTRLGTTWSAAVAANATPETPIHTWTGSSSTWLSTSSWSITAYPQTASDIAYFNNNLNTAVGINMNTLGSALTIGAINFGTSATTARTISNSSSAVSGILTISGLTLNNINNTIIWNQSTGTHIIASTNSLSLALGNSTDNVIAISNTGGITISAPISGTGRNLTKAGAGAGILSLTGLNTYTGLTTVSAGTLQLNRTGGTTIPATNDVTVTGGTLRISSNQSLNNLIVNGGDVTVDAGVTLTINGTLTLTSGKITLGTGNVVVNGSISGGSATSYIVTSGTGTLTQTFSSARTFPIGQSASIYDPITITPSASVTFSVKASGTFTSAPADASKLFPTEWDITPSSGSPTVNLALTPGSTAGNNFNAVGVIKLGHYTGTAWEELNATYSAGTFTATGISSFSPFGGGNQQAFNAVLPVTLTSFTAHKAGAANQLTWASATEQNTAEYLVERSRDAQNFVAIGKVSAQGKSATYNFTDATPLSISYYRLRAIDYDGKEMTSKTVSVSRNSNGLKVYPTLVADNITIAAEGENSFNIINLLGQVLISGNFDTQKEISTATLPRGTYFVSVAGATVKFVKE